MTEAPEASAHIRWGPWIAFALAVFALPVALMLQPRPAPPPDLGPAPRLALVDQTGTAVNLEQLEEGVVIVDFIFTRCPDVCPLLSAKMAWVDEVLAQDPRLRRPVHLLSVTVDPAYDTPEVLAEYAARYQAEHPRWRFLTGEQHEIDALVTGFDQALDRIDMPDGPPSIVHSERFVLIDPEGTVRGYYPSDDEGMQQLVVDARTVAGTWW